MRISTRFSIAVHMLLCVATLEGQYKVTSDFLAASVGVNPVIIRRLSSRLKKHGLLNVPPGTGGASLGRPAEAITLYDVYRAVGSVDSKRLFSMHERPNPACAVGRSIQPLLNRHMNAAQIALENSLKNTNLAELAAGVEQCKTASKDSGV